MPARSRSRAWPAVSVAVGTDLPQVGRSGQQVGGLAKRAELLGEVGTLEERDERRRAVAGPLVVRCEVAEPAQLVDTVGRDRLEVSGPGRVDRRRLAGQVGLGQDVCQQRVPEPGTLAAEHDHAGVDGLADRPGLGDAELRGDGRQCSAGRSGGRRWRGSG